MLQKSTFTSGNSWEAFSSDLGINWTVKIEIMEENNVLSLKSRQIHYAITSESSL